MLELTLLGLKRVQKYIFKTLIGVQLNFLDWTTILEVNFRTILFLKVSSQD